MFACHRIGGKCCVRVKVRKYRQTQQKAWRFEHGRPRWQGRQRSHATHHARAQRELSRQPSRTTKCLQQRTAGHSQQRHAEALARVRAKISRAPTAPRRSCRWQSLARRATRRSWLLASWMQYRQATRRMRRCRPNHGSGQPQKAMPTDARAPQCSGAMPSTARAYQAQQA